MIKSVHIKNFESIESADINLVSGSNVLVGPSNSGKTAFLRSLKMVLFNDFSQDSVRVGANFAEVKVVTDKGSVLCRKGSGINEWYVTRNGQETLEYTKIGRVASIQELCPDAADILGIKKIDVAGKALNLNIMDQLDGHFMLDEIDGDSATPSMNATIMDELCSLHKIEPLIQGISQDVNKLKKEIKAVEKDIDEFDLAIVKYDNAKDELAFAEDVSKEVEEIEEMESLIDCGSSLVKSCIQIDESSRTSKNDLHSIPDISEDDILSCQLEADKANQASSLLSNSNRVISEIDTFNLKLSDIPLMTDEEISEDTSYATRHIGMKSTFSRHLDLEIDKGKVLKLISEIPTSDISEIPLIQTLSRLVSICGSIDSLSKEISSVCEADISDLEDIGCLGALISDAESMSKKSSSLEIESTSKRIESMILIDDSEISLVVDLDGMISVAKESVKIDSEIGKVSSQISKGEDDFCKIESDLAELLSTIKTCPLTERPISQSCLTK